MQNIILVLFISIMISSCSQHLFVVRHAEKATTNPRDPLLSNEGSQRAEALKELLKNKNIKQIFSTPTQRTMLTAKPLSDALQIPTESYGPVPDQAFLDKVKSLKKNTLIVGHSNTVDDIVNGLTGKNELQDLPDSTYGNLYIIKRKGGNFTWRLIRY